MCDSNLGKEYSLPYISEVNHFSSTIEFDGMSTFKMPHTKFLIHYFVTIA